MQPTSQYDEIADAYEGLHKSREALVENQFVMRLVGYEKGSVLDIGCGTGLFLDYNKCSVSGYVGIDPSKKMLDIFRMKHPEYAVANVPFESFTTPKRFDYVLGLFGSVSYIEREALQRIPDMLTENGRFFLMFYKPDYCPVTYQMTKAHLSHFKHFPDVIPNADVIEFNNFFILTGGLV